MKKTLIALFALAGMTMGTTTTLTDLSTTVTADDGLGYLYSSGVFTDDSAVSGNLLNFFANGKSQSNVTFTLNLTEAANAVAIGGTPISLVNIDLNSMDIGLYLTSTGIGFGKAANSLQGTEESYTDLASNSNAFVGKSGDSYITLTFGQSQTGIVVWDNSESLINNAYKDTNNTSLTSISVNTNYIEGVQIYNEWPTNGDFSTVNSSFDSSMKAQLVPEPTTATLSLLALAGLAARRRRK